MLEVKPLYQPLSAKIEDIIIENSQVKTFVLSFTDLEYGRSFTFEPGQFMMLSVPHHGEAPISIASSPAQRGTLRLSVRRAGKLTTALLELEEGAVVGLRGPYGKAFAMREFVHKDLLFVAGGIGLAPLRSVIETCLAERERYGKITILFGSRTPSDIAFQQDIDNWRRQPGVRCLLTVDQGEPGWQENIGLVTTLFDEARISPAHTALVCGPPLMIRAVLAELSRRGLRDENIITTMERHMKCGVGVCRHCHLDDKLVCVDGPVFNLAQLRNMEVMELA